jgi:hypothetical protein
MRTYEAETLTDLHTMMTTSLIFAKKEELDVISNVDVQIHDVMGYAKSMAWEFDLKSHWLTKSRWSMMVNQYIDPESLNKWIQLCTEKIGTKDRGIALMRTNIVKPRGGAATGHKNKETRRWGSCMISISYKALPRPTIHLHSRTSYLGYIGALDLSVAWMCAKYLGHELGLQPEDFSFVWTNEAIQWHNFKCMAYLLNNEDPQSRNLYRRLLTKPLMKLEPDELELLHSSPALTMTRTWLTKVRKEDRDGITYGEMNYNTYRRIRRRWHTEVFGYEHAQKFEGYSKYKVGEKAGQDKEYFKAYLPLPNTLIQDLDFSCLKMPFGQKYGGDYVPGEDMEDDDDDE